MSVVTVTHSAGFFSCNTIRLCSILNYFNQNKKIPDYVDSSKQYGQYKINHNDDLTKEFFVEDTSIQIPFEKAIELTSSKDENQFSDYRLLNFKDIQPFIQRYFSLAPNILNKVKELEERYAIFPQELCAIRYRGNDKSSETNPPTYDEMIKKAIQFKEENPGMRFILQTDEIQFFQAFTQKFPETIVFNETAKISKCDSSVPLQIRPHHRLSEISYFLASIYILSKCKNIMCTSGNGEMWMAFFRGHAEGIIQYLNPKEFIYGIKNESYDPNKDNFWLP